MNKEILLFTNFELGLQVRAVEIVSKPYFIAIDVAKALGYSNISDALTKHIDEEDKQLILKSQFATLEIPNRGLVVINESGFYSLVLKSKMPKAKQFKRWVTNEVLPQIRQTGGYIPVQEGESEAKKQ